MRMRALPALVVAVLAVTLVACAPEPAPTKTPTTTPTSTPAPTPTPTQTGEAIAPGAQPPPVFDGDCAAALSSTDIDDVAGTDMTPYSADTEASIANAGGLTCQWTGTDASLTVSILPRAGIGDAQLPVAAEKQYFQDCDPTLACSWLWDEGDLWIAGTFQFIAGMSQSKVDGWGQELGDTIAANHAKQAAAPWVRDRTGWWPVVDCAQVATAVADALGGKVTGKTATYPDPPAPGVVMGDTAAHLTACALTVPGTSMPLMLYAYAGEAWHVRESEADKAFDTKVDGITGYRLANYDSSPSNSFSFTDGVNRVRIDVPSDAKASVGEIARAVAKAASGF